MSTRARAIQNLYNRGKITIDGVRQSVLDGVITADEFKIITGQDFE